MTTIKQAFNRGIFHKIQSRVTTAVLITELNYLTLQQCVPALIVLISLFVSLYSLFTTQYLLLTSRQYFGCSSCSFRPNV